MAVNRLPEQPAEDAAEPAVEQAGDGAEQVAEQLAGARDGLDQQDDGVEGHPQAEQVQVERTEVEAEDAARTRRRDGLQSLRPGRRRGCSPRRPGSGRCAATPACVPSVPVTSPTA